MKALRFDGHRLSLRSMRRPSPRRGEVLVRVRLAGICSTDIEILRGYMEFRGVPGHEFVGTAQSPAPRRLAGRRVTGEINLPCGSCGLCRAGLGKHCPRRSVLGISVRDGAFAEYLALPAANLHPIPDTVSDEEAVFTELLAAACEIPERVRITRRTRVAVIGDGRLAALAVQVLGLRTDRLVLFGIDPAKMETISSLGYETRPAEEATGCAGAFDVAVDCSGSPGGLPGAVGLVRPRGTVVLKSTFAGEARWNPSTVAVGEITIVGSRCGPFPAALELLERGLVKVMPLLTAIYPLERWETAFRRARGRGSFKVALEIGP
ncbi:MAG: alcohol dehydrogenase catalytic domain-containing protein [Candidatus Krumholzibacteria bacterium]|nr:alcohol dehydrogenase catalytic domain-containing protein [Candidatus Krumholzibacteria bacterium]